MGVKMSEDWKWLEEIESRGRKLPLNDVNGQLIEKNILSLNADWNKLIACIKEMREILNKSRNGLDSIKYELDASVYTLTDDEFDVIFGTRDMIDETLNRYARGEFEK
jgi:hypothetical protein